MAWHRTGDKPLHYNDVTMTATASHITSLTIVCSTVYSNADQRKHQSSASLAFVRGIHWRPVNSPHKGPVTRKMSPFDDVIMISTNGDVVLLTHTHSHTHIYIFIHNLKSQISRLEPGDVCYWVFWENWECFNRVGILLPMMIVNDHFYPQRSAKAVSNLRHEYVITYILN